MPTTITRSHAKKFDDWCRARSGNRYGYGGAFTTNPTVSTDCSGLVLQSGAYLRGRTDWPGNRYGSTESFRLDHATVYNIGFKRLGSSLSSARSRLATLGFKPIMLVGLQHGGGGIYSHTACTVFHADTPGGTIKQSVRGIDWESRGEGVFYYWGARAWDDPLFHDFWYLDSVLEAEVPVNVVNEINALAGSLSWIGARLHPDERKCLDGAGRYVDYSGGSIYWHPNVRKNEPVGKRAVAVPATIYETWKRVGWEQGPLGYPVAPHATVPGGRVQAFQGGAIYVQDGQPGVVMHGAILSRFAASGFEKAWGWPLGDETHTADGGREQKFSGGVTALWHQSGVVTFKES